MQFTMGCSPLWDAVHYGMQSTMGCSPLLDAVQLDAVHYGMQKYTIITFVANRSLIIITEKQASNNNNNNRVRRHRLKEFLCKLFSNLNSIR